MSLLQASTAETLNREATPQRSLGHLGTQGKGINGLYKLVGYISKRCIKEKNVFIFWVAGISIDFFSLSIFITYSM